MRHFNGYTADAVKRELRAELKLFVDIQADHTSTPERTVQDFFYHMTEEYIRFYPGGFDASEFVELPFYDRIEYPFEMMYHVETVSSSVTGCIAVYTGYEVLVMKFDEN